jgi:hypothetical protein
MDMWTDLDLKPYMAVTAHWIQRQSTKTSHGSHETLELRVDLIGFMSVPGSHSGRRLAEIFMFIINCLKIEKKVSFLEN